LDIDPAEEGQPVMAARVLVADDEDSIRRLLTLALSDAGYDVSTASDGVEAFQKFQLANVDLLVTDLKIGRMDGYELCKRVRQTSALPIVVISGGVVADEAPGSEASLLDADAVIRKPFDVMELVHVVRSLVPPNGG
jgi:DNA-binding response OmpR family regulator